MQHDSADTTYRTEPDADLVEILKSTLAARQAERPQYSLRKFAIDLQIDPSLLSKFLKRQRKLPLSRAKALSTALGLPTIPTQSTFAATPAPRTDQTLDNVVHFEMLSHWEYFAFLNLIELKDASHQHASIARRLGLSIDRIDVVIDNLLQTGLVTIDEHGRYRRTKHRLTSTDDRESIALQIGHLDEMRLAMRRMRETPVEKRDYCSMTVKMDYSKIARAKKLTRAYVQELSNLVETEDSSDVYCLSVQLFPLTKE